MDWWSTVEEGSDVVPFTTMDPEHRDELFILMLAPWSAFDVRVESLSPSLQWAG